MFFCGHFFPENYPKISWNGPNSNEIVIRVSIFSIHSFFHSKIIQQTNNKQTINKKNRTT
jgi:hypothetical protein